MKFCLPLQLISLLSISLQHRVWLDHHWTKLFTNYHCVWSKCAQSNSLSLIPNLGSWDQGTKSWFKQLWNFCPVVSPEVAAINWNAKHFVWHLEKNKLTYWYWTLFCHHVIIMLWPRTWTSSPFLKSLHLDTMGGVFLVEIIFLIIIFERFFPCFCVSLTVS